MKKIKFSMYFLSVCSILCSMFLAGCGIFEPQKGPPLTGKRVSLFESSTPAPFKVLQKPTNWPKPTQNQSWLMPGSNAVHIPQPTQMTHCPEKLWSVSLEGDFPIVSTPVIDNNRIFVLSSDGNVCCFSVKDGVCLWKTKVGSEALGGGVCLNGKDQVFVTSGDGQLKALKASDGKVLWCAKLSHPAYQAPIYAQDKVFCLNIHNQIEVFDACKGVFLWDQRGTPKELSFLGGSAPAVDQENVIVGYSGKEIACLNIRCGDPVWFLNDQEPFFDTLQPICDIRSLPVIDCSRVYVLSSENFLCLDKKTGSCFWKKPFSGTQTPLVFANAIYLIANHTQVLALEKCSGEVLWEKTLSCDPKLIAFGPIAAGERLYVVLSNGRILALDPRQKGAIVWEENLNETVMLTPVAGCGVLCIVTQSGKLCAFGKR